MSEAGTSTSTASCRGCVALQVGPISGAGRLERLAQRYSDWRRGAAPAELVKDVYILESSQSTARFFRLGADAPRMTPKARRRISPGCCAVSRPDPPASELPCGLGFCVSASLHPPGGQSLRASALRSDTMTGWQFDCPDSALVHRSFTTRIRSKTVRHPVRVGRLDHRCVGP